MHANKNAAPGWNREAAGLHVQTHQNHTAKVFTFGEVVDAFRAALRSAGLDTDAAIQADGRLHRFHVDGDRRGTVNGWYILHVDGVPAAAFGHWKSGIGGTWRASIGRMLTRTEQADHRARVEAARAMRCAEVAKARQVCRKRAATLWQAAKEVDAAHFYLIRKGIKPHGSRQHAARIVVPVVDTSDTLHGLQFIAADGGKRFLTDTAKTGCFHALGSPPLAAGSMLAIAEGFATAATIHEVTGWPTVTAFDAGNLEPVALALRAKYPSARIVIGADNDHGTPGNPGLTKGRAAARAIGGTVIAPAFGAGDTGTDWNDYQASYGRDATAAVLLNAVSEVRS
ncbi:toprim domain-containing protein [Nevskia ramosa]|uniref:toprim domain-containing protein n=1 Tax=Nevskia ramosa TaxID=64002 RepID=UPI0003B398B7|nr:toprim domain-containing protein [Nevskia ramosa]